MSLKLGVQEAFWRLGGVTHELQIDQSSTATHQLKRGKHERGFNEYAAFVARVCTGVNTLRAAKVWASSARGATEPCSAVAN